MVVSFDNLNSTSGLKKLDEYLLSRNYITGNRASKDDLDVYVKLYAELSGPPSSDYVHVSRWYNCIDALLRKNFEKRHVRYVNSVSAASEKAFCRLYFEKLCKTLKNVIQITVAPESSGSDDDFGEKIISPVKVLTFEKLKSTSGLKKLKKHLHSRFYITGFNASMHDIFVYCELSGRPSLDYFEVRSWYNHIETLLIRSGIYWEGQGVKFEKSTSDSEGPPATPLVADTKASLATDGDDDLLGEEIEDKNKATEEHAATAKASLTTKLFENFRSSCSAISTVARKIEKEKQC